MSWLLFAFRIRVVKQLKLTASGQAFSPKGARSGAPHPRSHPLLTLSVCSRPFRSWCNGDESCCGFAGYFS